MADPTALFVPLRSNAQALVAGAPVATVRRRLKAASIVFDRVLLEGGAIGIQGGPGGMFVGPVERLSRFQTASERHRAHQGGFVISVGTEEVPGVPASAMEPLIQSTTSVAWTATLTPFMTELSSDCAWIEYVRTQPDDATKALARDWSYLDRQNRALEAAIPERFVRQMVVDHANADMAIGVGAGFAVSMDALHQRVVAQRFSDAQGWKPVGFSIPLLFPLVADMDWSSVASIRRRKQMERFRRIMNEIEQRVLLEANDDLEATAHRIYEDYLADAAEAVEGLGAPVKHGLISLVLGGMTTVATVGLGTPVALGVGAASTVVGTIPGVVSVVKQRRRRGWISVHQALRASS